jgi:hypothetical protein
VKETEYLRFKEELVDGQYVLHPLFLPAISAPTLAPFASAIVKFLVRGELGR